MIVRFRAHRGRKPWELDCGYLWVEDAGTHLKRRKRVQLYFSTRKQAEEEMAARVKKVREFGRSALELSESERVRFVEVRRRCERLGASLEEVLDFYEREQSGPHRRVVERVSLETLVERALAAKEGRLREGSLTTLRVVWRSFLRGREMRRVEEITGQEVLAWLGSSGWGIRTQRNYLGDLRGLFRWGISPGVQLVERDPTAGVVVQGREDEEEISCMTPGQARRLIEVAARAEYVDFLGYVALGLFAGLRSVELERGKSGRVDLAQGVVVVAPEASRTRTRRAVALPRNAVTWLRVWRSRCPEQTRVLPRNWEKRWKQLRVGAGWTLPWPKNVMRHTAASMHFAMHEDEAGLKKWLGHHKSEDTLFRNYRAVEMLDGGIISKGVAREYWGIRPRS